MKTTSKSKSFLNVDKTHKKNSTSEELIKRTEVETTPFTIVTVNGKSFGVFNKYRITEEYDNEEAVRKDLLSMNWNKIVTVMSIVHLIIGEMQK